jgi:MFS transporter, DHA3 family, tetracycline resistance protein
MAARDRLSYVLGLRLLQPFRHSEYRRLIAALAVSVIGAGMWTVVMPMQVLELNDDDAQGLALVVTCYGCSAVLSALVGGVAADRLSQRRIILGVQLLNFLTLAAIAPLAVIDRLQLWELAVAATLLGVGSGLFAPAFTAYLPRILPEDDLVAANGVDGVMRSTLQQAIGPTLAGALLGATYPDTGLVIIAVLFAISLTLLFTLRPATAPRTAATAGARVWTDLRDGLLFVVTTRWLFWTLVVTAVSAFSVTGPAEVLLPYLTQEKFVDHGPLAFGSLLAAVGIGAAVGAITVSSRGLPRRYLTVLNLGTAAGMLTLIALGNASAFAVMAAAAMVIGLVQGMALVIRATLLQRRVPREKLGRVASVDVFVTLALVPVSTAVTGALSEVVSPETIFAVAGCIPIVAAFIAVVAARMNRDELEHPLR